MSFQIAKRYATALLEEAQRQGKLEEVYADIRMVSEALHNSRDLQLLLKSPIVKSGVKGDALKALFSGSVSELTSLFLALLVTKKRERFLAEISRAFFSAYNRLKNIREVELISAAPLDGDMESNILDIVKTQLGASGLEVAKSVKPGLLGGFVIRIDDKVFDTSLHGKISALRRQLLAG